MTLEEVIEEALENLKKNRDAIKKIYKQIILGVNNVTH